MGWSDERLSPPRKVKSGSQPSGSSGTRKGSVVREELAGSLGRWGIEQDILFSDAIDELFVHSDVEFY